MVCSSCQLDTWRAARMLCDESTDSRIKAESGNLMDVCVHAASSYCVKNNMFNAPPHLILRLVALTTNESQMKTPAAFCSGVGAIGSVVQGLLVGAVSDQYVADCACCYLRSLLNALRFHSGWDGRACSR